VSRTTSERGTIVHRTARTVSIAVALCLLVCVATAATAAMAIPMPGPTPTLTSSFSGPSYYGTGHYAYGHAVGDVDGDGDNDIVTADSSDGFSVALNNGAGACTVTTEGPASYVGGVQLADLNADGMLDLVAQTFWAGHNYTIYAGNGDGTFSSAGYVDFATLPSYLLIDDFTGDGKVDLMAGTNAGDNTLLFPGNGDFTFGSPFTITGIGYNNWGGAKGDINNDGRLDFVVANTGSPNVDVRLNEGGGAFAAPADIAVDANSRFVRLADLDRDGKLDLVVQYNDATFISWFKGDGAGGFTDRTDLPVVNMTTDNLDVADVNGDGAIDVLAGGTLPGQYQSEIRVLLNNGRGEFPVTVTPPYGEYWAYGLNQITAANMDASGLPDLVATHTNSNWSNNVTVILNTGANPGNRSPAAIAKSASTSEDTTLSGTGLLSGATDPDFDALSAVADKTPAHGTLAVDPSGSYTYVPAADYNGSDSFTYRVFDGAVYSAPATVTITVTAVADAPIASEDEYSTNEDTYIDVPAPGVLGNDVSPDGRPLELTNVSVVHSGGYMGLYWTGQFNLQPTTDFNGDVVITYKAYDGVLYSTPATVTIHVLPVNDAPTAREDTATVNENATLTVAAAGVLANDGDIDGDPLTAEMVDGAQHGTATLSADGSYVYRPEAEYYGEDTFTYRSSDGTATSGVTTVRITVNRVNNAPVGRADTYTVDPDKPVDPEAPLPCVLTNDSDADGDPLTAAIVKGPSHAALFSSWPNGTYTYLPAPGFYGTDTFTYRAFDGTAYSDIVTVTITVQAPTTVTVGKPMTPYRVRRNRTFLVYGSLSVWHPPYKAAVSLRCYRFERGKWVFHKKAVLNGTSSTIGRYAGYTSLPELGSWCLVAEHLDANGRTSRSPARYMYVR